MFSLGGKLLVSFHVSVGLSVAQLVKNPPEMRETWIQCPSLPHRPGFIPGSGRSAGEGIGYPFRYSWTSLLAQLVKNPLAMWETWVQSLGWEDSLEKGKATHSSVLAWRIPWIVVAKSWRLSDFHFH